MFKTIHHKGGRVSIWNIYKQQWIQTHASFVTDNILATLPDKDRQHVTSTAKKNPVSEEHYV
jgi:hypothetical protein